MQEVLRSFRRATKGLWGRVVSEGRKGKGGGVEGRIGNGGGAVAVI